MQIIKILYYLDLNCIQTGVSASIYVGCYADVTTDNVRDLSGLSSAAWYSNTVGGGSLETCIAFCIIKGFTYAGAEGYYILSCLLNLIGCDLMTPLKNGMTTLKFIPKILPLKRWIYSPKKLKTTSNFFSP